MANFVSAGQAGTTNAFDAFAFDVPSPANLNFFQQRLSKFHDVSSQFAQRAAEVFEQFSGSEVIQLAKAAVRTAAHLFSKDVIRPLETVDAIQQAKLMMQRFIMAYPPVREMYHRQQCDGYSSDYVDMHPDVIGEKHYDWQLINNGLLRTDSTDPNVDWSAKTYVMDDENDVDPSLREKTDIIEITWAALANMMVPGNEDPTSKWAAKL